MNIGSKKTARRSLQQASPQRKLNYLHGVSFLAGVIIPLLFSLPALTSGCGSHRMSALLKSSHPASETPWGNVECKAITLERPDESLIDDGTPVPPTAWFFGHSSQRQALDVLSTAGLSSEQMRLMTNPSCWKGETNGWMALPPQEVVRSLSAESRRHIYAVLRNFPENPCHRNPVHILSSEFDAWLANCDLPEGKKQLFQSLTYVDGDTVYFADFECMEAQCTLIERKQFAKAISQSKAVLMTVKINPDSDVEALTQYWGRGGRGKAMKPLLESMTRLPEGAAVNVSIFLPTFARMRLYTYPDPKSDPTALREDCFWTAMNFFNEKPDNGYLSASYIENTLREQYSTVTTNWTFGDVLVLFENGTAPVHMCVYVADDVVFTKNGMDDLEPWRLMKMSDMMITYRSDKPVRLCGYRRKSV